MEKVKLNYEANSCQLFEKFVLENWAIFLDSCYPTYKENFIDIIAARPNKTIKNFGQKTYIQSNNNTIEDNENSSLNLLKNLLKKNSQLSDEFCGGALGFIGYEYNQHKINIYKKNDNIIFPDLAFGIYDWAIITNHQEKTTHIIKKKNINIDQIIKIIAHNKTQNTDSFLINKPPKSNLNFDIYSKNFYIIKDLINSGDCYQINLSQQFTTNLSGSSWELYKTIRNYNPAPFSAYFKIPEGEILSFSPEKFIETKDNLVITEPMKGTRKRTNNPFNNKNAYKNLKNSPKDRAENLMIVDLMRNDLGQSCVPGSINVPKLFEIKAFKSVYQLISCVTGKLPKKDSIFELIDKIFPGGSITGAPKRRSREIINQLEPHNRHIYCGSIGYIDYAGNCSFNIAIRTLLKTNQNQEDNLYFWGGGGIVADSNCKDEYNESLTKIRIFNQVLQQNNVDSIPK